jgi:hypothetical protein
MRNALLAILVLQIFLLQALAVTPAAAQSTVPVLRYTPPANAIQIGTGRPDDYNFTGFNGSVQIYPFQPFTGNIQQAFQTNLLRQWIAPQYQEQNLGGAPQFAAASVPGADLTLVATFLETGYVRIRRRVLIIAGNHAAIVDASAGTQQSFAALSQYLGVLGDSLRVDTARAPAPLTVAGGRAVAGLYQGMAMKVTVNTIGGGLYNKPALHYYLFSADGRVYRKYDVPPVAPANIASFDFDAAEQADRSNSGRYTIDNGRLIIRMQDQLPDIVTEPPRDGVLTINSVTYKRQ